MSWTYVGFRDGWPPEIRHDYETVDLDRKLIDAYPDRYQYWIKDDDVFGVIVDDAVHLWIKEGKV